MLAYFSYVALMFSLTLMFFLGLMFFGTISPEPAAPPASLDSADLGLPPITGAALLRFASYAKANPAAMPGVPESPAAEVRKSQSPRRIDTSTHRHIKVSSLGTVNRTARNRFAEPFAIVENAALSVRSNIMDMDDVSGIKVVRYVQEDDRAASE